MVGMAPLRFGFAQVIGWFLQAIGDWLVSTRFREMISPTAGGGALVFLLSLPMPEAWRAVAGAVAKGTTPINAIGDSLLTPVATWLLMKWPCIPGTWSARENHLWDK